VPGLALGVGIHPTLAGLLIGWPIIKPGLEESIGLARLGSTRPGNGGAAGDGGNYCPKRASAMTKKFG
jgi:hypothetical protein